MTEPVTPEQKTCPICFKGILKRGSRFVSYTYRGKTIKVKQPGDWCNNCHEGILSVEDMKATEFARRKALGK